MISWISQGVSAPLSLRAKFRFPETETLFEETRFERAAIEQEGPAFGTDETIRLAGRRGEKFPYHGEAAPRFAVLGVGIAANAAQDSMDAIVAPFVDPSLSLRRLRTTPARNPRT